MYPVEPIGGGAAPSQIDGASSRQRCGNDGQRKRVAHMPTATTTKEDSRSKLVQNHPHDFTKKLNLRQRKRGRLAISRGSSLIAMMQTADFGEDDNVCRRREVARDEAVGNPCRARNAFWRHDNIENSSTERGDGP